MFLPVPKPFGMHWQTGSICTYAEFCSLLEVLIYYALLLFNFSCLLEYLKAPNAKIK